MLTCAQGSVKPHKPRRNAHAGGLLERLDAFGEVVASSATEAGAQ
jgi:hypothetical protein